MLAAGAEAPVAGMALAGLILDSRRVAENSSAMPLAR